MLDYIINNIRSYAEYLTNYKDKDPFREYRGKEWFTIAECKEIYDICNGLSVSECVGYALDDVIHDAYVTIKDLYKYKAQKEKDFPKEVFQLKEGEWNYY